MEDPPPPEAPQPHRFPFYAQQGFKRPTAPDPTADIEEADLEELREGRHLGD